MAEHDKHSEEVPRPDWGAERLARWAEAKLPDGMSLCHICARTRPVRTTRCCSLPWAPRPALQQLQAPVSARTGGVSKDKGQP